MKSIQLGSTLELKATVHIKGFTQPNSAANTNAFGQAINAVPLIEVFAGAGADFEGVLVNAPNSIIEGLIVNRFASDYAAGIDVAANAKGSQIRGSFIGTDAAGTAAKANYFGITVQGDNVTIGGSQAGHRNLISGNSKAGIFNTTVLGVSTGGTTVKGNYIGTDKAGNTALANKIGVHVRGPKDDVIGGQAQEEANLISGNTDDGILLEPHALDEAIIPIKTVIQSNRIGTNAAGAAALANGLAGVHILNGTENTVGGTVAAARNLISGNTKYGVHLEWTLETTQAKANNIWGNWIGIDSAGAAKIANRIDGVYVQRGAGNIIGGGEDKYRNVISGNGILAVNVGNNGIHIRSAVDTVIQGNYIGTKPDGTGDLGNANNGILLENDEKRTKIGGDNAAEQNVICYNRGWGIDDHGDETLSKKNRIGKDKENNIAPNKKGGIALNGKNASYGDFVAYNEGPGIQILGDYNAIITSYVYANEGNGIEISGTDNIVQSSRIGTDELGGAGLGNLGHGIYIDAGNSTLIGGSLPYANLITGNTLDGISVVNTSGSAYANTILTNSIYNNGGLGIDLGNNGVTPNDSLDPDDGPNHFQNFPVIESATYDSNIQMLNVLVTLNSTANSLFTFELFLNDAADPSGYGEGETPIPGSDFTTDANGNAVYGLAIMPFSPDPTNKWLTATATRWENGVMTDTSEFSQAVQVTGVGGGGGGPPGGGTFGMSSGDNVLAIGAVSGDWPLVQIADARTGRVRFGLVPYATTFRGGVRTAVADVNGDGVPDIITAPGEGGSGTVFAFDGVSGKILHRLTPFPGFAGGLFVSAGDIDGDRKADIVVSMDSGGGDVAAYSGATGVELRRFSAFAGFTGGVRLALGDVNGDGKSDILVYVSRLLGRQARNVNSSAARISRCSPASSHTNRRSTAASMSQPATSTATAGPTSSPAQAGAGPHRRTSSAATARCSRAFARMAMHSRAESASRPAMSTAMAASICC